MVQQRQLSKNSKSINISIHLMLWFNPDFSKSYSVVLGFQYILCYGSTIPTFFITILIINFNTSYVMVQPHSGAGVKLLHFISIHLMLWFNFVKTNSAPKIEIFQYILCYGSTRSPRVPWRAVLEFQYILCYGSTGISKNGLVTLIIFQYILCYGSTTVPNVSGLFLKDFNTSYVMVQPLLVCDCYFLLY